MYVWDLYFDIYLDTISSSWKFRRCKSIPLLLINQLVIFLVYSLVIWTKCVCVCLQSGMAFRSSAVSKNGQVSAPLAQPEHIEIADYSLVKVDTSGLFFLHVYSCTDSISPEWGLCVCVYTCPCILQKFKTFGLKL